VPKQPTRARRVIVVVAVVCIIVISVGKAVVIILRKDRMEDFANQSAGETNVEH
jgi:hypothetical protein